MHEIDWISLFHNPTKMSAHDTMQELLRNITAMQLAATTVENG